MNVSFPLTEGAVPSSAEAAASRVKIPQLGRRAILAVWAAAALPMAALAWIVTPAIAGRVAGAGDVPMAKAMLTTLTGGLVWQFVLVAVLLWREQGTLRWSTIREALWLHAPQSPRTGRRGGRLWLVLIPLIAAFAIEALLPTLSAPAGRDLGAFLGTHAGQSFMHGAWGWFGLAVALFVFNTVLGEELLFRGFLLPRMQGAFGRGDWLVNGLLFAVYHLHMPWAIPVNLVDTFTLAYPTKRYRSAWMGIAVHSSQSVVLAAMVLALVIR